MSVFIIAPTRARGQRVAQDLGLQPTLIFSVNSPASLEGMLFREGDRVIIAGIAKNASGLSFPIMDVLRRSMVMSHHVVEPEYVP